MTATAVPGELATLFQTSYLSWSRVHGPDTIPRMGRGQRLPILGPKTCHNSREWCPLDGEEKKREETCLRLHLVPCKGGRTNAKVLTYISRHLRHPPSQCN